MVTAIEELTKREDFLDRCLLIHLPYMPNTKRDYERELMAAYEEARPRILGALLKAVSAALKNWKDVKLERVPRMADFARWVTAAEPGLGWQKGDFMRHYTANRKEANQAALNNPLAAATLAFAKGLSKQWSGHGHRTAGSAEETRHGRYANRSIVAAWPQCPVRAAPSYAGRSSQRRRPGRTQTPHYHGGNQASCDFCLIASVSGRCDGPARHFLQLVFRDINNGFLQRAFF